MLLIVLLVEYVVCRESPSQTVGGLTLEQYQLGSCRIFKDPLKVHCVVYLILGLKDLLELEVVMTVSERIKVDVAIVLPTC